MGAISLSLQKLADTIQAESDEALSKAENNDIFFEAVAHVVGNAIVEIRKVAEMIDEDEPQFTSEQLKEMIQLANALDSEDDERLQRQASTLDAILMSLGSRKAHDVMSKSAASEEETNRLREKYRALRREELYFDRTSEEFNRRNRVNEIRQAVKDQVKEFKPLEHPLSTRYCPDHPGAGLIRIADHVYQCSLDHKMYNYEAGFTTMKGNKIPGGGVNMQTPDWGHRDQGHTMFDTRQSLMSRLATQEGAMTKNADDMLSGSTPEHKEGDPAEGGGSWHWDENGGYWTIVKPGAFPGQQPMMRDNQDKHWITSASKKKSTAQFDPLKYLEQYGDKSPPTGVGPNESGTHYLETGPEHSPEEVSSERGMRVEQERPYRFKFELNLLNPNNSVVKFLSDNLKHLFKEATNIALDFKQADKHYNYDTLYGVIDIWPTMSPKEAMHDVIAKLKSVEDYYKLDEDPLPDYLRDVPEDELDEVESDNDHFAIEGFYVEGEGFEYDNGYFTDKSGEEESYEEELMGGESTPPPEPNFPGAINNMTGERT